MLLMLINKSLECIMFQNRSRNSRNSGRGDPIVVSPLNAPKNSLTYNVRLLRPP